MHTTDPKGARERFRKGRIERHKMWIEFWEKGWIWKFAGAGPEREMKREKGKFVHTYENVVWPV